MYVCVLRFVLYEFNNGVLDVCVCRNFLVGLCMFTVSIALLLSKSSIIMRAVCIIRLNPLAIVLLMICRAMIVEWFLKPCCVLMCCMLFV